jgi:hypothetical protein
MRNFNINRRNTGMRVKPDDFKHKTTVKSVSLASAVASHQKSVLEQNFDLALHKIEFYGAPANETPRILDNKCDPGIDKARVKGKTKKVRTKDKESCNQKKVKPVPPSEPVIADDSERYAMWWDFHDDLSKRMPTKSIDTPLAERRQALTRQRKAKESKNAIANKYAFGVTPRSHQRTSHKLIGNAPLASNKPDWSAVLSANKDYHAVLVDRWLDGTSIVHGLHRSVHTYQYAESLQHLDHLGFTTKLPVQASDIGTSDMDTVIANLEKIVDSDTGPIVMARDAAPFVADQATMIATANVFDMELKDVLPFATNDSTWEASEAQYERNQWGTEEELTPQQRLQANGQSPLSGNDHMQYCLALGRMEEVSLSEYNFPENNFEGNEAWLIEEGFAYLNWLLKHRSSIHLRTRTELSLKSITPDYTCDFGTSVHALLHVGTKQFEQTGEYYAHRRLALFDLDILDNCTAGQWYERTSRKIRAEKDKAIADAVIDTASVIDQAEKELLTEMIVDMQIEKMEDASQSSPDTPVVDELVGPTQVTTVSEDSPSAIEENLAYWKGKRESTAEVVSLSVVRNKRTEGVSSILAAIKPKLEGLTEEQKEGVRSAVLDALNKALG